MVVCAACSGDREGAPSRTVRAPRTIELSATAASPEVEHSPGEEGNAPAVIETPEERLCKTDHDCAPDFCDRGVCATPGKALYGRDKCEPDPPPPTYPPPPPGMKWGAPSDASDCGSYICIDRRCRSCKYDVECGEGLACKSWRGFPGKACGRAGPEEPHIAKKPPPMPPMLGEGAGDMHPPDPSGRQILQDPSQFQPPPRPNPSK